MRYLVTFLLIFTVGASLVAQSDAKKAQIAGLYREAHTFLLEGDTVNACRSLEKLLKSDKANRADHYLALGRIAEDRQQTQKAIKYYLQSIKSDKTLHKPYYSLGALYYNNAVDILNNAEQVFANAPKQREAEVGKGLAFLKKARPYLEKGLQLSGDTDIYQSTLQAIDLYLQPQ